MKRTLGKQFFYHEIEDSLLYSQQPSAQLAPDRLLRGQADFWINRRPAKNKIPKTILINFLYLQRRYQYIFEALLNWKPTPFNILVIDEDRLLPYTSDNEEYLLGFRNKHKNTRAIFKDSYEQLLRKHNLDPARCLYLDLFQLSLLHHQEKSNSEIDFEKLHVFFDDLDNLVNLPQGEFREHLNALRSFYPDNPLQMVFTKYLTDSLKKLSSALGDKSTPQDEVLKIVDNLPIKLRLKTEFNVDDLSPYPYLETLRLLNKCLKLNQLFSTGCYPVLKELELIACSEIICETALSSEQLKTLEKINVNKVNSQYIQTLLTYLAASENLTELEIFESDFTNSFGIGNIVFKNLQTLKLRSCTVNAEDLKQLLKLAPNLQYLFLDSMLLTNELNLEDLELPSLKKLSIRNPSSNEYQFKLINIATNLEEILFKYDFELKDFNDQCLQLPSLRKVKIINRKQSNHFLAKILKSSPSLESLDTHFLKGEISSEEFDLSKIEKLSSLKYVRLANANTQVIEQILLASPNLETLDLAHCEWVSSAYNGNKELRSISITSSRIEYNLISSLFETCEHLRSITLSQCDLPNEISKLDENRKFNFPRLKKLDIDFPSSNLAEMALFATGPQLEEFGLDNGVLGRLYNKYAHPDHTEFLKFLSIKSATIYGTNAPEIWNRSIEYFLLFNPLLEELYIKGKDGYSVNEIPGNYIYGDKTRFSGMTSLSLLKIGFYNLRFDSRLFLEALFKSSPNLLEISLFKCYLDENELLDLSDIYFPRLTTVVLYENQLLSRNNWQQLKNNAPFLLDDNPFYETSIPRAASSSTTQRRLPDTVTAIKADTTDEPNKTFHINRLFYAFDGHHPDPATYRIDCYDTLTLNPYSGTPDNALELSSTQKMDLQEQDIPVYKGNLQEIGEKLQAKTKGSFFLASYHLNPGIHWQPLPCLTADDKIIHIQVEPEIQFKLAFDAKKHQYRIAFDGHLSKQVKIQYIIQKNPEQNTTELPRPILEKINAIRNFGNKTLALKKSLLTGQEYLDALSTQKTGACRHRMVVFKAWMDKNYPQIPTLMILNGAHAFVEVYYKGAWQRIDFGGYAAKLEIKETLNFKQNTRPAKEKRPDIKQKNYNSYFNRYKQQHLTADDLSKLLDKHSGKILIKTRGTKAQHEAMLSLYQQAKETGMPVFWVDSADDLYCASQWIEKNGLKGKIKRGPGGKLHDFLTDKTHQDIPVLLLINYAHFEADEIIRFNSLLDDTRKADGTALPEHCLVIGVQDLEKPDCYQGADFSSRFQARYDFQATEKRPEKRNEAASSQGDTPYNINLYNASDWKERLLGRWQPNGQEMKFIEGELIKALKTGRPIVIHNAPEEDECYQLLLEKLHIDGQIENIPFDKEKIHHFNGYNWNTLRSNHQFQDVPAEQFFEAKDALILNLNSLPYFFPHTDCDNERKELIEVAGYIKKHRGKHLSLLLTEELKADNWAELLDYANANDVQLKVLCLPEIALPEELPLNCSAAASSSSSTAPVRSLTTIKAFNGRHPEPFIHSSDLDVTLSVLKQNHPDAELLFVNELKNSDLFEGLVQLEGLSFIKHQRAFAKALIHEDRTFILAGPFDDELFQALLPWVQKYPEKLILVSEQPVLFSALDPMLHEVNEDEKWACLSEQDKKQLSELDDKKKETLPLCQLRATSRSKAGWAGYYQLKQKSGFVKALDLENSEERTKTFLEQRMSLILDNLVNSPFVFIGGMTGVGKSTFIHQHFSQAFPGQVFYGEEQIKSWAERPDGGYLFIDEANISRRNWSEFESLFQSPLKIYLQGQWYQLTAQHKVIFAGNPMSYGGSRHQPKLFERHGNSVIFNPLPPEAIYQQVLRPIFENSPLNENKIQLSEILLKAYQLLVGFSNDRILVSPRQLKSIAMLTIAGWQKNQQQNPEILMHQYLRVVLTEQLDPIYQKAFQEYFPEHEQSKLPYPRPADYYISASREKAAGMLTALLGLRQYRKDFAHALNEQQLYGDLNSLVLESQPGQGKTQLLQAILKELQLDYYYLPVTLSLADKTALLLKAFNEGSIVIIDEINSSPMVERLLNALLSGQTPDGKKPDSPGFLLLGTQNPVSMGARIDQTEAQKMRMIKINLPEYSKAEMSEIIIFNGFPASKADELCVEFQNQQTQAKNKGEEPLNFRQLLDAAQLILTNEVRNRPPKIGNQSIFSNSESKNEAPATIQLSKSVLF